MEDFTPESQEMFNNIGNPEAIARFRGRAIAKSGQKAIEDDKYKDKYLELVRRMKLLEDHFRKEAFRQDTRRRELTEDEDYFKANEALVTEKISITVAANIAEILQMRDRGIIIIDDIIDTKPTK